MRPLPFRPYRRTEFYVRVAGVASVLLFIAAPAGRSEQPLPVERGIASFYGWWHHGKKMANGRPFDALGATAAHPTLPLGAQVIITNLNNGRTVQATIADRGPYVKNRSIDLSLGLARRLGMEQQGLAPVSIELLDVAASAAKSPLTPKRKPTWHRKKPPLPPRHRR